MYTSKDISDMFGIMHRDVTRKIRSIIEELRELSGDMFIESEYARLVAKGYISEDE